MQLRRRLPVQPLDLHARTDIDGFRLMFRVIWRSPAAPTPQEYGTILRDPIKSEDTRDIRRWRCWACAALIHFREPRENNEYGCYL